MPLDEEISDAEYDACKRLARHLLHPETMRQDGPQRVIQEELTQQYSIEYAHVGEEDAPESTSVDTARALTQHYATNDCWQKYWIEEAKKKGYSERALQSTRAALRTALLQCYQQENATTAGAIETALDHFRATIHAHVLDFRKSGQAIDILNPLLMRVIGLWREQGFSTSDFDLL